jgi:hypothetical protein
VSAPLTPLQAQVSAVLDALATSRRSLGAAEYDVLLDIVAWRLAQEYIAGLGVFDDHEGEAAA